jgi:hypothetical protein
VNRYAENFKRVSTDTCFHFGRISPVIIAKLLLQDSFNLPVRNISVSVSTCDYSHGPELVTEHLRTTILCLDQLAALPGKGLYLLSIAQGEVADE